MRPVTTRQSRIIQAPVRHRGDQIVCDKCGSGFMVDDSDRDIRVYKCWVCGNRLYIDYPKRDGSLVCSRCGNDMDTENELGYCTKCVKGLNLNVERLKERTYGETRCACGKTFIKKSPTQVFHAKDCRGRWAPLQL